MTSTSSSFQQPQCSSYLELEIESAQLTKNKQTLGVGKMDPYVTLTLQQPADTTTSTSTTRRITRTPTHWDAHKEPVWFHECPRILLMEEQPQTLVFTVYNDSTLGAVNRTVMATSTITAQELVQRARSSKAGSLGRPCSLQLPLEDRAGTLLLCVSVKDPESFRVNTDKLTETVDPSWFESPVQRLGVSGGTAPFFALVLTEEGMQQTKPNNCSASSQQAFIGKDLSHAADEQEFYQDMKRIKEAHTERDGVGLLSEFMLDYLGVLTTKTTDEDPTDCQSLLVMQNMRHGYRTFRMLDLKMGQQTAQGGWQGKSRFRAMKQSLLDGMTNSVAEGYRLEGFDGSPQRIDSMDPLMDLLAKESTQQQQPSQDSTTTTDSNSTNNTRKILLWGRQVTEKDAKKAKRLMLQTLTGAEIFRYFIDVHLEQPPSSSPSPQSISTDQYYLPVEVAELVLHELVSRLIRLAVTCHKVKVPQKWIGSSVALGYDAGWFPPRDDTSCDTAEAQQSVRDKVLVKVFDWGRSELLTADNYKALSPAEQQDRHRFWDNYKNGMDRLAYNATREYYHHFTCNTTQLQQQWKELTLQVMDFDSMTADDYMGKVTIALPDPDDTPALQKLQQSQAYTLQGAGGTARGSIYCSIAWVELSSQSSRLAGIWRITVERATDLPVMDYSFGPGPKTASSDPYCIVIAKDTAGHRELQQMTCVQARSLNPVWNETLDVPVVKADSLPDAFRQGGLFAEHESFPPTDRELAKLFPLGGARGREDLSLWTACLHKAAGG